MRGMLEACAKSGVASCLPTAYYMYGAQTRSLTEDMPLTDYGRKPRVRAEITRLWQQAYNHGDVRSVAVRASDFYGPNVSTSVLSTLGVARLLAGKPALAPYAPDQPHDFTFVPDFARALVTLIEAPDDVYGEAWHVPNAPTRSLRELLTLAAMLMDVRPRITERPPLLVPILGLFRSGCPRAEGNAFPVGSSLSCGCNEILTPILDRSNAVRRRPGGNNRVLPNC
jgi:nucleoside-diphosphate-sugar epimerase